MLAIPAATVRNWEDRYGLVKPARSDGGHRLYTRTQLEQLRFVKERVDRGMQPAEAHRLLGERLEGGGDSRFTAEGEQAPRLLILLAERDPLRSRAHRVLPANRGLRDRSQPSMPTTPLESSTSAPPALAVIELLISGGTGAELCRRLKEAGVPACLAVSALDERDLALAAGRRAFMQKPLDPLQLVSTVKDLLGRARLRGERRCRVIERLLERPTSASTRARRRPPRERDQPDHRPPGTGQDDPRRAVPVPQRARERPGALPVDGSEPSTRCFATGSH